MLSFRLFLLKSLTLIGMVMLLGGCGEIRYRLVIYAEPELEHADIYIDDKLVRPDVYEITDVNLSLENHKIEVIQKGFKPFVGILKPPEGGESMYGFKIRFEPFDTTVQTQTATIDTFKVGE